MKQILQGACLTVLLALAVIPAGAADTEDKAGPKDNMPPAGFTALFNGKDLSNWQGAISMKERSNVKGDDLLKLQQKRNDQIQGHWTVKNGILQYDGKAVSLQSAKDYGNFELLIDWKIAEKGDSGLYLRGQPQVQIWDSDRTPGAKGADKGSGSGGLWNNPAGSKGKMPLKKADKPVGEWNTFRILMKGDKATVYLNGELVVDDAPLPNYWEKGQPLPSRGPIELQHHGDPLWFKNIYIKELP